MDTRIESLIGADIKHDEVVKMFNTLTLPQEVFSVFGILGAKPFEFSPTGIIPIRMPRAYRPLAPVVGPNAPGIVIALPPFGSENYVECRRYRFKFEPDKLWLLQHKWVTQSPPERLSLLMVEAYKMLARRYQYDLISLLTTGILPGYISGTDDAYYRHEAINFGMASANKVSLSANYYWSGGSLMNPRTDLITGINLIQTNGAGETIDCIMSPENYQYLLNWIATWKQPASGSAQDNIMFSSELRGKVAENNALPSSLFGIGKIIINREQYHTTASSAQPAGIATKFWSVYNVTLYPRDILNPENGALTAHETYCDQMNPSTFMFDYIRYFDIILMPGAALPTVIAEAKNIVAMPMPDRVYTITTYA